MVVRELVNLIGFKVDDNQIKNANKKFNKFKAGLKTVGVVAAVASVAAVAFAKKSLDLYDKQAEAIANVEATLKSTGESAGRSLKQLEEQAKSLQDKTFFGDETILQGVTAQMLTFTNITKDQFDRAQTSILDVTAKLYGLNASEESLRSTTIQLSKALNDPVANLGALSRSGIQFSEDQKEVIKSLWEVGKTAEAQSLILKELEKQYGGTAEALTKTGKGQLKQIQNQIGDLMEDVGKKIIPLRLELLKLVKELLNSGLADVLFNIVNALFPLVQSLMSILKPVFNLLVPVFETLSDTLGVVGRILSSTVIPFIKTLANLMAPILNDLSETVSSLFETLEPIISLMLNNMLITLKQTLYPLLLQLKIIFAFLKPLFSILNVILNPFFKALNKILEIINVLIDKAMYFFYDVIDKAVAWVSEKLSGVKDAFIDIFAGIGEFFNRIINSVIDGLNWLIEKTNKIAKTKIELIERIAGVDKTINEINNNQKEQNNFLDTTINMQGGTPGSQGSNRQIANAAGSIFNLQLKKVLIENGGL